MPRTLDTLMRPAVGAALLASPVLALAAEESPSVIQGWREGLPTMIATLLVFGIVFVILATQVWPRIVKGLEERADKIRREINAAEEARQQAKESLAEYEKSLAEARAEAKKMLEHTKAQQQAMSQELRAKADQELARLKERARRDIDAARKAAVGEVYAEGVAFATLIASRILQREVNEDDHRRLVDETLRELQATRN